MKAHYDLMVRGIEEKAEQAMGAQVLDVSSPYCGAVVQPDGVFQAKSTMYAVASLVTPTAIPAPGFTRMRPSFPGRNWALTMWTGCSMKTVCLTM